MKLWIGQAVHASDGPFGELDDIVVDPKANQVTHLVVQPLHRHQQARLLPLRFASVQDDVIVVDLDGEHIRALEQVADRRFVRLEEPLDPGPEWDIGNERVLAPVAYAAMYPAPIADGVTILFDRVPHGRCEVDLSSPVITSDGHRVGSVEGSVTGSTEGPEHSDSDSHAEVSGVVVRTESRGSHHFVVVSLDQLARVRADDVTLGIDRSTFRSLPVADSIFGPADSPSTLARIERSALRSVHSLAERVVEHVPHR